MSWLELTFLSLLVTIVCCEQQCIPSCRPPSDVLGCLAFITPDKCFETEEIEDITVGGCGCLWQNYIRNLAGDDRDIVLSNDGLQCYVWATTVCEAEKAIEPTTTAASKDVEIDVETGDVFGKVDKAHASYKAAEKVVDKIISEEDLRRLKERGYIITKKKNWFNLNSIQYDKFKLGVFGIVLLFNVACVIIAVCCRLEKRTREKEIRLSGDLDPNKLVPSKKKAPSRPARYVNFDKFLEKLRLAKKRKREKAQNPYGMLEMDHVRPRKTNQNPYSPMPSRPTFNDSIDEQSDLLDTTYEEPIPSTREIHPSQLRRDSLSDEETLYQNTRRTDGERSVSFKIPPGLSADQVERVGSDEKK